MNIAVLLGGISTERSISLKSGRAVANGLKNLGHNVFPIDPALGAAGLLMDLDMNNHIDPFTLEELAKFTPKSYLECLNSSLFDNIDVAFIVLHGKYGEDGLIQSLLELRGIPYTGSNVKSSALAMDKIHSKILFTASGVPTPAWTIIHPKDYDNYDFYKEIRSELGAKIVIKPNDQGSTIGVTVVETGNLDDIHTGIMEAAKYSKNVLIEKYIEGREMTVSLVGDNIFPIIEIIPEGGYYDYKHKYTKGQTEYQCPADLDEYLAEFTQNMADMAFRALGCYGFGRVDFRLDEDGQPFCLEVNTIPGFTETSLVPKAAAAVDIGFDELCQQIIDLALNKDKPFEETE
ncbi:MAG: D-alanine--D-alanine ligase [Ignavibacteria bacterium]|nr:D-alanine--D-alanine ligase [Ignavibacteria bacterium]